VAKKKRSISWIVGILALTLFTVGAYLAVELLSVPTCADFSKPLEVTVPRGANLSDMADIFVEVGLAESRWQFIMAARIIGVDRKLRAGRYTFPRPLSPVDLVKSLTFGGSFDVAITFPEGFTVFEIADLAADSLGVSRDDLLALCFQRVLLDSLGIDGPSCEGYLFPETYSLPESLSARELISRMHTHFKSIWTPEFEIRARAIGMSQNEIITLASIIEGEAHVQWEQPVISSVYHNRLRAGMLLQADPTVIYGLRSFDRALTLADLDTSSSLYNSYRFPGLPPGPINNPGVSAVTSALWPDSSDYLYFVSNEDGTHWFNETLSAHYDAIHAIRDMGKHGPMPIVHNRNLLSNNK